MWLDTCVYKPPSQCLGYIAEMPDRAQFVYTLLLYHSLQGLFLHLYDTVIHYSSYSPPSGWMKWKVLKTLTPFYIKIFFRRKQAQCLNNWFLAANSHLIEVWLESLMRPCTICLWSTSFPGNWCFLFLSFVVFHLLSALCQISSFNILSFKLKYNGSTIGSMAFLWRNCGLKNWVTCLAWKW